MISAKAHARPPPRANTRARGQRTAQLLGRGNVHVVEPGAAQRDRAHAKRVQCLQDRGIQTVVDEHADRIEALGQAGRRGIKGGVEVGELERAGRVVAGVGLIQEPAIVRAGAEDGGFHG
jgi:hypothetical protein